MKYLLGGVEYASRKAVHERYSSILRKGIGDMKDRDDLIFACALLMIHRDVAEKAKGGVSGFAVRPDKFGSACFWVKHDDGSYTHFGIKGCIYEETPRERLLALACRSAIMPDIQAFRDALTWPRMCPILNVEIGGMWGEAHHIDHAPPWEFDRIFKAWLEMRPDPPYEDRGLGEIVLSDAADIAAFREHHNHLAVLRAVSARANVGVLRRKR